MKSNRAPVIALIIGLVAGALAGVAISHRNYERDLAGLAFVDALGRINTASTTLRMIEKQQVEKAIRLNELMLRSAVVDAARYSAGDLGKLPLAVPSLRRSITEAETYATRREWTETSEQLRQIQQAMPSAR